MLFYLVRHGQTDWNRAGKIQGTTDIPLNETGRQQAEQLATVLKERSGYPAKTRIDAVYASPLARAFQTAEILAKEEKLPLRRLTGLRERDFGCWEGKSWQQVEAEYPDEFHLWREQPMDGIPSGGESRKSCEARSERAIRQVLEETAGMRDRGARWDPRLFDELSAPFPSGAAGDHCGECQSVGCFV